MEIIGRSLLEVLILVSLSVVMACLVAAIGGFIRFTTRLPGGGVNVNWLMKLGIFAGVPFSIIGMTSGYMTGSSRVGAISALVPAGLTLIGGVTVFLFSKGGKAGVLAAFAVINFSVMTLVGALIGGRERMQTEQIENSVEYREAEIQKDFLLQLYRQGLGMDPQGPGSSAKKPPPAD
jgi:hypothetical protein